MRKNACGRHKLYDNNFDRLHQLKIVHFVVQHIVIMIVIDLFILNHLKNSQRHF